MARLSDGDVWSDMRRTCAEPLSLRGGTAIAILNSGWMESCKRGASKEDLARERTGTPRPRVAEL